jgi:hypothetical protein
VELLTPRCYGHGNILSLRPTRLLETSEYPHIEHVPLHVPLIKFSRRQTLDPSSRPALYLDPYELQSSPEEKG